MVPPHDVAHNSSAFLGGLVGTDTHLIHAVQQSPVNRFQPVTYAGQRAADNDRHRVVEIAFLDLVFDGDGYYSRIRHGVPLDVQVGDGKCVLFDELAARCHVLTHQRGENLFGLHRILELDLYDPPCLGIHGCFP